MLAHVQAHYISYGVVWSIKISTGVSVGAGLSLHRHQANFSRVFDIYFGRYYYLKYFHAISPNIFFSLIFHLVFCPLETRKQCNVLKAGVTLNIETWRKVQFANWKIFRFETENHPKQRTTNTRLGLLSGNLDNTTPRSMSSLIVLPGWQVVLRTWRVPCDRCPC